MDATAASGQQGGQAGSGFGEARIVQLKAGEAGAALFIVPGFGGSIERLRELGGLLATPMPVFAIEGRGADGQGAPDTVVQDMAEHYLGKLLSSDRAGPYFLAGHSFGGLVALEMARRLLQDRRNVACLILLDSNFAEAHWPRAYYLSDVKARVKRRSREFLETPFWQRPQYVADAWRKLRRRLSGRDFAGGEALDAMAAHEMAFARYDPGSYPGRLNFLRASLADYPADPEALWRQRVHQLDIYKVPGGHISMLEPPHVPVVAKTMSLILERDSSGAV